MRGLLVRLQHQQGHNLTSARPPRHPVAPLPPKGAASGSPPPKGRGVVAELLVPKSLFRWEAAGPHLNRAELQSGQSSGELPLAHRTSQLSSHRKEWGQRFLSPNGCP